MNNMSFVNGMRKSGKLAAKLLNYLCDHVKEGMTTNELDQMAYDFTLSNNAQPSCLGYKGYPKTICASVNEVLCHGVPNDVPLKYGDVLNIDVTVTLDGYFGDTSRTVIVGQNKSAELLLQAAKDAMNIGIEQVKPGIKTGLLGFITQSTINAKYPNFGISSDIGGHGIGKSFHMSPFIPGTGLPGNGPELKSWTCITVEPLVFSTQFTAYKEKQIIPYPGAERCAVTEVIAVKGMGKQFEHTVLITDKGFEILTEE